MNNYPIDNYLFSADSSWKFVRQYSFSYIHSIGFLSPMSAPPSSKSMSGQEIRVAIIGGGLAGALLVNALTKYPQLDVQLYEAKSELQERGASVGLSVNAQRAMRLLGLEDVTRRASAVKVGCLQLLVVRADSLIPRSNPGAAITGTPGHSMLPAFLPPLSQQTGNID